MKRFAIALVLVTLPALVAAQAVTCADCTHEVSVYMGEGGLVAEAAMGAEMVTYVSRCGGVTSSGQLTPNADRLVAMLFTACSAEGARLELGPVMDGGWFWITDDMNSAVGPLVNQSILENETIDITSAGAGVTMMAGKGAVFMKETATGRVGILPNILPEAPMAAVPPCGYRQLPGTTGTDRTHFAAANTNCALGDGILMMRVRGPADRLTGVRTLLEDGATVIRPRVGSVTVLLDVWGNGSGHFNPNPGNSGTPFQRDPRLGHLGSGGPPMLPDFIRAWAYEDAPGGPTNIPQGLTDTYAGLGISTNTDTYVGTLRILPSAAHCGTAASPLHHSVRLYLDAAIIAPDSFPRLSQPPLRHGRPAPTGLPVDAPALAGTEFNLTVACP